MERAIQMSVASGSKGSIGAAIPRTQLRPSRKGWDRMLTYQTVAVAVLLVALLGSIASGGGGGTGRPAVISATQEPSESVAMYREDAARTGVSTQSGPASVPEIAWTQDIGDQALREMIYADGIVYLNLENLEGEISFEIQARDVSTGAMIWSSPMKSLSDASLLVAGSLVYVSTSEFENGNGDLIALSAATGEQEWTYEVGSAERSSPAVFDGIIYLLAPDRTFRAIDAETGKESWSLDVRQMSIEETNGTPFVTAISGMQSPFSPAIANGLAFITAGDGVLYAIDLATRDLTWFFKSDGNSAATPTVVGDEVYVTACNMQDRSEPYDPNVDHCWLYQLDAADGNEIAKVGSTGQIDLAAVTSDLVVARVLGRMTLLSTSGLNPIIELPEQQWADPAVTGSTIYGSDNEGTYFAYQYGASTNDLQLLWTAYVGNVSSSVPLIAERLLITTGPEGGDLIALKSSDATPVAGGEPVDLSGLPACVPPPPVDWESLSGEPKFTIADQPADFGPDSGYGLSSRSQAWLDYGDLPSGGAASEEARAGISETIQLIIDCLKPGFDEDVTGFFTEDFFRRNWVRSQIDEGAPVASWFLGGLFPSILQEFQTATLLPDGRVAILADPSDPQIVQDFAMFVIFVEVDGRWVVDESIRVGVGANQG